MTAFRFLEMSYFKEYNMCFNNLNKRKKIFTLKNVKNFLDKWECFNPWKNSFNPKNKLKKGEKLIAKSKELRIMDYGKNQKSEI